MSIELAIIPVVQEDEKYADDVLQKIKSGIHLHTDVVVSKDYNFSLNNRIAKQRQLEKIIIVVDSLYTNDSKIVVRFSDKGSRARKMNIDEFITKN
jgi:threonyl-tRNA synthetase